MSSIMNTVAKEAIQPKKIVPLAFIDKDISGIIPAIKNEKEARMVLSEIRGY